MSEEIITETKMIKFEVNGVRYEINEEPCSRCRGTGNYSYCQLYGTKCFKCAGSGKQFTRPKGQPKMETTCARLEDAKVGDIIEVNCILYQVVRAKWQSMKWKGMDFTNQRVTVMRLLDGETRYFSRGVCKLDLEMKSGWEEVDGKRVPLMRSYVPTPEEIGKIVQEDISAAQPIVAEVGAILIIKLSNGKYALRVRNEDLAQVYVPGNIKEYTSLKVAQNQAKRIVEPKKEGETCQE